MYLILLKSISGVLNMFLCNFSFPHIAWLLLPPSKFPPIQSNPCKQLSMHPSTFFFLCKQLYYKANIYMYDMTYEIHIHRFLSLFYKNLILYTLFNNFLFLLINS